MRSVVRKPQCNHCTKNNRWFLYTAKELVINVLFYRKLPITVNMYSIAMAWSYISTATINTTEHSCCLVERCGYYVDSSSRTWLKREMFSVVVVVVGAHNGGVIDRFLCSSA